MAKMIQTMILNPTVRAVHPKTLIPRSTIGG